MLCMIRSIFKAAYLLFVLDHDNVTPSCLLNLGYILLRRRIVGIPLCGLRNVQGAAFILVNVDALLDPVDQIRVVDEVSNKDNDDFSALMLYTNGMTSRLCREAACKQNERSMVPCVNNKLDRFTGFAIRVRS